MYIIAWIIIIVNQNLLCTLIYNEDEVTGTASKLLPNFSRVHPSIPVICLEQRYIPVFV